MRVKPLQPKLDFTGVLKRRSYELSVYNIEALTTR